MAAAVRQHSKSMRGPNIQEVFFANSGGQSMNPFLKGEKAETRRGGFNANAHDLLFKQDGFQLKAVYFETGDQKLHIQPNLRVKTARSATVRRRRRKSG